MTWTQVRRFQHKEPRRSLRGSLVQTNLGLLPRGPSFFRLPCFLISDLQHFHGFVAVQNSSTTIDTNILHDNKKSLTEPRSSHVVRPPSRKSPRERFVRTPWVGVLSDLKSNVTLMLIARHRLSLQGVDCRVSPNSRCGWRNYYK